MEEKYRLNLSYRTAVICGIFCLVVSLLLIFNYLQFSSRKPLESDAMQALIERLAEDPRNDELKQDIRNLDLLARKAYFSSQWQIRTGSYLLLFGAIVFAVSLRYYHSLRSRITEPEEENREKFRGGILTQKWILGTGGVLIVAAIVTAFLTENHLDVYDTISEMAREDAVIKSEEEIEVIDLSQNQSEETPVINRIPETAEVIAETPGGTSADVKFPSRDNILAQHNTFRGPWGHGVSGHKNIPVNWDGASGSSVIWKKEIPKPGYNSPVIWDDLLFLSGADNASQVIYCYNRNTGELKWQAETGEIPGSPAQKPKVTDDTGLAAPGLATDGSRVYAIFATGDVVCFSKDGNRLWARNLGVPDNHYGHSSSLMVWNGKLFIQFDSSKGGRLLALNVLTGESDWDIRRSSRISWASPILVEHKGNFQLVLSADPVVAGYDIETGMELWSIDCMMGEVGPSPAYGSGIVYAANEYARLAAIDLNNPTDILWEDDEYLPEVSSPVVSDGLLFVATSYGVFVCYDAKSGEKYWEQEYGGGFYSSPVVADGKVYALDMGGNMHIFKVNKEYGLAGEASLGEKAYATPAFTDGRIYIRGEKHLFCIGN
jgi:outer membrane protein assembly factor BamB